MTDHSKIVDTTPHNNLLSNVIRQLRAFKMNFIKEYLSDTKISESEEIYIFKGTTEATLKGSSKHLYVYLY